MKIWRLSLAGMAIAVLLAACGGSSTSGTSSGGGSCNPSGGSSSGGTPAATVKVVSDPNTIGKFDPATITVKVGDTVEWDFQDSSSPHTVTAQDGSFDSCTQNAGFKFSVTFSKAGDVQYHCTLHSAMTGDVKVG